MEHFKILEDMENEFDILEESFNLKLEDMKNKSRRYEKIEESELKYLLKISSLKKKMKSEEIYEWQKIKYLLKNIEYLKIVRIVDTLKCPESTLRWLEKFETSEQFLQTKQVEHLKVLRPIVLSLRRSLLESLCQLDITFDAELDTEALSKLDAELDIEALSQLDAQLNTEALSQLNTEALTESLGLSKQPRLPKTIHPRCHSLDHYGYWDMML
jgi:hypothetical protein